MENTDWPTVVQTAISVIGMVALFWIAMKSLD